ncbi:hypothetical protein HS088_TW19G00737 [Tripterygium wilfordii]|uniref:Uncharacterized protein n=1 Tax=Tripterygium wilfordii TaxID=458696 RepID=A0A7J7CAK4_TRIWF|nr:hypothetical protein HS088_TW19G00737 [Tripterygium wilfordii]
MSALIDIWTSELAKLREKDQLISPNASSPSNTESSQPSPVEVPQVKQGNFAESLHDFMSAIKVKPPVLASEASISMLVDFFSA